ncbi:DNA-3-methyladenine glycosylase family protein [Halobacterium litoreum]|uniref:DNA-3-methyladenine glycosylase family protein n=1 Tax=Halobacterium litoreum TaxID=2039234 RepID=A0ABD5NC13_9EURY|nr:DNA-3-methyladenine glycosylase 2 family protein [Halobacterium litoreum]UHH14512.1 DNA-3-methyladenine glycosylase 2 family protein [Halobacterium litoreum]
MSEQAVEYLRDDRVLSTVVNEHGPVTLEPVDNLFQRFVISIIRQQVSMQSAAAIRERLFDTIDVTPRSIERTNTEALLNVGLSQAKADYIQNIATAFMENEYSHAYFEEMSNDDVVTELTNIKGVGPWTARMQLMFGLGRPDVFPVEDLGIRKGMETLFEEEMTRGEMRDAATRWKPFRSYASLYLWKAYED